MGFAEHFGHSILLFSIKLLHNFVLLEALGPLSEREPWWFIGELQSSTIITCLLVPDGINFVFQQLLVVPNHACLES